LATAIGRPSSPNEARSSRSATPESAWGHGLSSNVSAGGRVARSLSAIR
jgi:hypothetical protein